MARSKRKYPYNSKLGPDRTSGDGRRANGVLRIPLEEILKEAPLFPDLGLKIQDGSHFGPPVPVPLTKSFSGMGFLRLITHTQTGKPIRPFQADTYIEEVTDAKYQNRQLKCDLTHIDFAFRYAVCVVRKCGALEPEVSSPDPNHIAAIHISSEDFSPLWYSTKLLLHLHNAKHFIESEECSNHPWRLMCELIGFGLTLAESQFRENYLELVERENQNAERDSKAVEAMKSTRTQIAEGRRKKFEEVVLSTENIHRWITADDKQKPVLLRKLCQEWDRDTGSSIFTNGSKALKTRWYKDQYGELRGSGKIKKTFEKLAKNQTSI